MTTEDARRSAIDVITAYFEDIHRAPSLRASSFAMPDGGDLGPLVHALGVCGGAPNLEDMGLKYAMPEAFEHIGAINTAGGLSRLRSLTFNNPQLTQAGTTALLQGVEATPHRGVSLYRLYLQLVARGEGARSAAERDVEVFNSQLQQAQAQCIFANASVKVDFYG